MPLPGLEKATPAPVCGFGAQEDAWRAAVQEPRPPLFAPHRPTLPTRTCCLVPLCICTHANLQFPGRNQIIRRGVTKSLPAPGPTLCLFVLPSMQNQKKKKKVQFLLVVVRRPEGREALLGGTGAPPQPLTGVRQGTWLGLGLPYSCLSPPTQVCGELPALQG